MPYADKDKAREYQKLYHLKTWPRRKSKHLGLKHKRRIILATWLNDYKKFLFCTKCDENHPACLDFHHKNGAEKDASIANMISEGYSIKTIEKEIDKCVVLCRNCHAKEHYQKRHASS